MSGGIDFDEGRFVALARYVIRDGRMLHPTKLAWGMLRIDFEMYAREGRCLTGATYLRGQDHPEVAEMGDGWFERFIRAQIPWHARILGRMIALYALARTVA